MPATPDNRNFPAITEAGRYDRRAVMADAHRIAKLRRAPGHWQAHRFAGLSYGAVLREALTDAWRHADEQRQAFLVCRHHRLGETVTVEAAPGEYADSWQQYARDRRRAHRELAPAPAPALQAAE